MPYVIANWLAGAIKVADVQCKLQVRCTRGRDFLGFGFASWGAAAHTRSNRKKKSPIPKVEGSYPFLQNRVFGAKFYFIFGCEIVFFTVRWRFQVEVVCNQFQFPCETFSIILDKFIDTWSFLEALINFPFGLSY